MNRVKHFYKKNTLIIKILSSYFIIGFLLLSIFSFVLIRSYNKRSLEEVNKTSEKMIAQSYYTADILLTNTYYTYYQLFSNNTDKDITNALYASDLDQFFISDLSKKLNQYVTTNPIIRSIYIYNSKADKMIYRMSQESGGAQGKSEFFDKDIIEMLDKIESSNINTYFSRKANYTINDKVVSDNLVTLVFANVSSNKKVEEAIIVNLNQEVLQKMLTSSGTDNINQMFIIYENGKVITHSDASMINENLENESYIKAILQSENKKGYVTSKVNNKDSLVTFVKADRLRWIFIGVGEYNKLLSSALSMQRNIIILTIIFIAMGLVVAVFFASSIYNPFQRLLQDIQKRFVSEKKDTSLDVYDYLKYTFNELADDVDKYKIDSNQLLNEKKNSILQRIVDGDIDADIRDANLLSKYGIKLNSPLFCVIILKIDSHEVAIFEKWSNKANLIKFAVLNIACEILNSQHIKAEGIDNGSDFVSIILNLHSKTNEITNTMEQIQKSIEEYLKCTITVSIGEVVDDISYIADSYERAVIASNYRIAFGRKSIISYETIANRNSTIHEYPQSIEKQIIDSIKGYNIKKLELSLNEFFQVIADNHNADEILMSVMQFLLVLTKTISSINKTGAEDGEYNFKAIFTKVQSFEVLDEIKKYLYSICYEVIETNSNDPEKNKRIKIVNDMRDYIEQNYKDQNINTDVIADYVGLSCNYARTTFKELMSISLTDYITQCRMKEAQRLLLQTDYSVKSIAELLGYPENSKYFYTIFKKYCGSTPDDYRNKFSSAD
jgi:AraC-like DNA-binding protein